MKKLSQDLAIAPARGASARPWLLGTGLGVTLIALVKLAVHLYAGRNYGYFVDELYYLDCARHLDWGYVDQPPLIGVMTWLVRATVGDSLSAIRLLPALCGAMMVLLTGLLARELGGGRFAQGLAALCVLLAPGLLGIDHFLSMNCTEPLFWMGCAWLILRMINTGNMRLWLWFGVVAGIGLENKYSMGIFGVGLVGGLLLTRQRRLMASKWFWIGGAIAFLIFLPNLMWNIHYHFPFLELQRNIRESGRNVALSPLRFFGEEIEAMQHLSLPIWLGGLWFFFIRREGRTFCFLGWAWMITALVIVFENPRIYYLFPAFPVLFAGGAVLWERWLDRPRLAWLRWGLGGAMILMGIALAPIAIPLLPPETYIRYSTALHLKQPTIENHDLGPLPQLFADQFGWPEMAAEVARVYNSLPADVRPRTAIFGQSYGQAGAVDLFGPRLGLPRAISGHQSYFLWGPRGYTGESMIVLGDSRANLESLFTSVEWKAHVDHPYSMPYNHIDIYYCRGLKQPLAEFWPKVKNWN
ncbi:MAG: glycosyltransferase family 39 protein [Terracidiphilus sp.]